MLLTPGGHRASFEVEQWVEDIVARACERFALNPADLVAATPSRRRSRRASAVRRAIFAEVRAAAPVPITMKSLARRVGINSLIASGAIERRASVTAGFERMTPALVRRVMDRAAWLERTSVHLAFVSVEQRGAPCRARERVWSDLRAMFPEIPNREIGRVTGGFHGSTIATALNRRNGLAGTRP